MVYGSIYHSIIVFRFLSNEWVIETVYEFYKKGDAIGACNKLC